MKFAGKWKELENIILSEVTQTQKDKHVHLCSSICRHVFRGLRSHFYIFLKNREQDVLALLVPGSWRLELDRRGWTALHLPWNLYHIPFENKIIGYLSALELFISNCLKILVVRGQIVVNIKEKQDKSMILTRLIKIIKSISAVPEEGHILPMRRNSTYEKTLYYDQFFKKWTKKFEVVDQNMEPNGRGTVLND
ncbi:hypothetical protein STEG23_017062 [Scotinomys teguina]